MKYSKLILTTESIESVIEKIKLNTLSAYQWFPVRGKNKCFYELGGRNYENTLEIKAYIPSREDDKYVVHANGMIKCEYSLTDWGEIEFPTFCIKFPKIKNIESMINFLKTTDFKSYYPKIEEERRRSQEYETIYICKS